MRWLLLLLASTVVASASPEAIKSDDAFGLKGRIRILHTGFFLDGGTTCFRLADEQGDTLEGCFDGRTQVITAGYPSELYIGSLHASRATARRLPLGGQEERRLVELLSQTLRDSLGSQLDSLLKEEHPPEHDSSRPTPRGEVERARAWQRFMEDYARWTLGCVARWTEGRRHFLESLDRGQLAPTKETLEWFGLRPPITLVGMRPDSAGCTAVSLSDSASKQTTVGIPLAAIDVDSSWVEGKRGRSTAPRGSWADRYTFELVGLALRDVEPADSTQALFTALALRKRAIISADSTP